MTVDTSDRAEAPQIEAWNPEPAGEESLICQKCGHIIAKVVVCGTQHRCTPGKYDTHYHCIVGCKNQCASLGQCVPREK